MTARAIDTGSTGIAGTGAIAAIAAQTALVYALTTLPTPVYRDYAQRYGFSILTLTFIYATYVVGTISTLTILGRVSDQIGRKPVLLAALGVSFLAAILFLALAGTAMLFLARLVTGIAAGLTSGTAVAWLRELYGKQREKQSSLTSVCVSLFGLGCGPLLGGWLAGGGGKPVLPFIVYILLAPLVAIAVLKTRETKKNRKELDEVSLAPRAGVPRGLRTQFLAPGVITFVIFSLSGFYSAIAPNLMSKALHIASHGISGTIVFELFATAGICAFAFAWVSSRAAMLWGAALMLPALICLVWAQAGHSLAALLAGTAFGGASLGLGYRGTLEVTNAMAPRDKRAELLSTLFVCGNSALALPVIGVGVLTTLSSPPVATYAFAGVIALLSISGLLFGLRRAQA